MIFEDWELSVIENALNASELSDFSIKTKIQQIRSTSINKRYSLRTTDWLSESGKRRHGKKKDKIVALGNLMQ